MKNDFVVLNKIETHIITWGNPFDCNGKDVIVCVTGNPGIPDFYIEFASELHKQTDFPVCIIGQAGHEHVPDTFSNCLKNQHHLFNLEGQLQHKLDFINNNIDKKSKLHFIGHSIGAWEVVELVDRNENLLNKWNSLPMEYNFRIGKFLNPYVGEKVLFLAYDEMDSVKELNLNGIDKIKYLCNVVYSARDDWAPLPYINDLRVFQPHLQLVEVDINHTFVMKSSVRVANIVIKFILQKKLEFIR